MPAAIGPNSLQVLEYRDLLVTLALVAERVSELVGRLGAERTGRRIVADRLIPASQLFERPGEVVIDPDVARVTLLSLPQHGLGRHRVAGVLEGPAQKVEADGPERFGRGPGQTSQRLQASSLVGQFQNAAQVEAPRVRVDGPGQTGQKRRTGQVFLAIAADGRPVVERGRQRDRDLRRPVADAPGGLVRGDCRHVQPRLAESFGVRRIGAPAAAIVGFGMRISTSRSISRRSLSAARPAASACCRSTASSAASFSTSSLSAGSTPGSSRS